MRVQLQAAYVLHRRPFRDSSMLIDVLTVEHGLLSLVARGLNRRRRGGPLSALLQPFKPLLLSFSGRGDLLSLGAVEAAGEAPVLLGDTMLSGLYVNELLLRLLHRFVAHPNLFSAYATMLAELASSDFLEPSLRRFEFALLDELGYGVDVTADALSGETLSSDSCYTLVPELGFRRSKAAHVANSAVDFSGADLLAIGRQDYDGASAPAAKRLVRELLQPHLGNQPLRTRAMFSRTLTREAPPGVAARSALSAGGGEFDT